MITKIKTPLKRKKRYSSNGILFNYKKRNVLNVDNYLNQILMLQNIVL